MDCGRDWALAELDAAVEKGPHMFSLEPDAIAQIREEGREKEQHGFARIYPCWKVLRCLLELGKGPMALKLPPLAKIPHKLRKYYCTILDLSFALKL